MAALHPGTDPHQEDQHRRDQEASRLRALLGGQGLPRRASRRLHGVHEQEQTLLGDHPVPEGRGLFHLRGISQEREESSEEVIELRIADFELRIC